MSNSDVIRDFVSAWNRRDLDAVMEFFTPDCVYHNIPIDPVQGTEAIRAMVQAFAGAATKIDWIVREIAETRDGAVLTERIDAFEFGDRTVELPVMGIFELEAGKISAWRDYFDMAQFQRQMSDA